MEALQDARKALATGGGGGGGEGKKKKKKKRKGAKSPMGQEGEGLDYSRTKAPAIYIYLAIYLSKLLTPMICHLWAEGRVEFILDHFSFYMELLLPAWTLEWINQSTNQSMYVFRSFELSCVTGGGVQVAEGVEEEEAKTQDDEKGGGDAEEEEEAEVCSLCLGDMEPMLTEEEEGEGSVSLQQCGHKHHAACLGVLVEFSMAKGADKILCPLCRHELICVGTWKRDK